MRVVAPASMEWQTRPARKLALGAWLLVLSAPTRAANVEGRVVGAVEISATGVAQPHRSILRREQPASGTPAHAEADLAQFDDRGHVDSVESDESSQRASTDRSDDSGHAAFEEGVAESGVAVSKRAVGGARVRKAERAGRSRNRSTTKKASGKSSNTMRALGRSGNSNATEKASGKSSSKTHAPVLVKVPFVHVSGPGAAVCKGRSLWTGKTAGGEDECERKCADMDACRFLSFSNANWCRLTATCDSTWQQNGKTIWIFSKKDASSSSSSVNTTNRSVSYVNIKLSLTGLSYTKLVGNSSLLESFENAVKGVVAAAAGAPGLLPTGPGDVVVVVTAGQGFTEVDAKVTRPSNATLVQVLTALKSSVASGKFAADVALKVGLVQDLGLACALTPVNGSCGVVVSKSEAPQLVVAKPTVKVDAACADAAQPGLQFVNGSMATCPMLKRYCNDANWGATVRDQCTKTCGFCSLELATTNSSNGSACSDGSAADAPRYEENGLPLECPQLKTYCDSDEVVKNKCRLTCGGCSAASAPAPAAPAPAAPAPAVAAPTVNQTATPVLHQSQDSPLAQTCSRRRMMGYCVTRRRRVA